MNRPYYALPRSMQPRLSPKRSEPMAIPLPARKSVVEKRYEEYQHQRKEAAPPHRPPPLTATCSSNVYRSRTTSCNLTLMSTGASTTTTVSSTTSAEMLLQEENEAEIFVKVKRKLFQSKFEEQQQQQQPKKSSAISARQRYVERKTAELLVGVTDKLNQMLVKGASDDGVILKDPPLSPVKRKSPRKDPAFNLAKNRRLLTTSVYVSQPIAMPKRRKELRKKEKFHNHLHDCKSIANVNDRDTIIIEDEELVIDDDNEDDDDEEKRFCSSESEDNDEDNDEDEVNDQASVSSSSGDEDVQAIINDLLEKGEDQGRKKAKYIAKRNKSRKQELRDDYLRLKVNQFDTL